jgi:hypothetical protein
MKGITDFLLRKTLFRPVKLAESHLFQFDAPFEELWFPTPDGQRLNALLFPTARREKSGVVLYFHGNRDHLQRWGAYHGVFTSRGYDFLIPDYRGYGKSSGVPDEQDYFEDATLLYHWLQERYPPEQIVFYGRSLGTGMAAYLAARQAARSVILETPFNHIRGLLSSHLYEKIDLKFEPIWSFPNDEHLRQTTIPVLIFHGTRDRVVPYASAAGLKPYLKAGDLFVTIEGGSHHNLGSFPEYVRHMDAWLGPV